MTGKNALTVNFLVMIFILKKNFFEHKHNHQDYAIFEKNNTLYYFFLHHFTEVPIFFFVKR
ncbi:hypothetical protein BpHYR1_018280 [Brachionus plicatilis]|uniref:Uncharacterized protein n=1 Tax=Brachionus plicatilis TaxID=10195 RepID=A0A3M7Q661_BRAPC|nr:hypothetical protein BpHYR1_018280 [Brachionus plicatilis]